MKVCNHLLVQLKKFEMIQSRTGTTSHKQVFSVVQATKERSEETDYASLFVCDFFADSSCGDSRDKTQSYVHLNHWKDFK